MQKSILDLLKFIVIFVIGIISIDFSTSYFIDSKADFKLSGSPKYIVVGHSHPECAFDDMLISDFKNVASSGEPYFYIYFKLKKFLEQNSSIKVIFVEYTNNQVPIEVDKWIWSDMALSNTYLLYAPFVDLEGNLLLFKNNPLGYLNAFSYSNKSKISSIIQGDFDYSNKVGGYLRLIRNDLSVDDRSTATGRSVTQENISNPISESNLSYLGKIVELQKLYNMKVVFIRSPQHKDYVGYSNEAQYKEVLEKRFPDIEYLDFSDFPSANMEFGDFEHLNHTGATRFSNWFENIMKQGLLEKEDKQKFIEEMMLQERVS